MTDRTADNLKRQQLQALLDARIKEAAAINEALLAETNPVARVRLESQRAGTLAEIEGIERDLAALSAPPRPAGPRPLRPPVPEFQGRQEQIDALAAALRAGRVPLVRGLGGVGKTELAHAVAQRVAGDYPGGQILVELAGATNPLTPERALQSVLRVFMPEAKLPDDLAPLQALYAQTLAGKRILVLADDARDARHTRPLLPPAGCGLLVTTRNRFALPGMFALDLAALPAPDAEALLLALCPRIGAHAAKLAGLCGRLPLALRVSAGVLANTPRAVPRYLAQLEAERLRMLADPDDPGAGVEASLTLSYDALPPEAQRALCRLSVFAADFDREAAEAVLAEADGEALLELLYRRSLLECDTDTERYVLHDLVQAFAAARLEDADTVRLRYARHYAQVAWRAGGELYNQGGEAMLAGLRLFDQERAHIDAGWAWVRQRTGDDLSSQLVYDYANAILPHIGPLRYDARRERIPLLEAQRVAANSLNDRRGEGSALGNLGSAYADLGEPRRAIEHYEQHLTIARAIGDRRGEGNALGNLGGAYYTLGEVRRAIEHYEQQLAIAREIGDRRGEGNALGGLGNAYYTLGEVRRAIEHYEQQLAIAREIGDRRGEGNALGGLGNAYYTLGEVRRAIEYYEQHLTIAREIGDRQGEGNTLGNLGGAYYTLGEVRRAIEYYEQQLTIAREIGDRRGEGIALQNLGSAHLSLGELDQARNHYAPRLIIAREMGDLVSEMFGLWGLARISEAASELEQASTSYGHALELATTIGDRRNAAMMRWNLGIIAEQQGDLARAAELMQDCVDYEREINHPDAEQRAEQVEAIRRRIAEGPGGAG